MTIYGLGQTTASILSVSSAPIWEIYTTAVNKTKILEFGFISAVQVVVGAYGIGRSSSVGVNPTLTSKFFNEQSCNAPLAQTSAAIAWGKAPGIPTNFNRRITINSGGNATGVILTFPRGFGIIASNSIVLWALNATAQLSVYAVIDE